MSKTNDLLKETAHRPWELPTGSWRYYQQWNQVLFFHWMVDPEIIKPLLPANLDLDLFDGKAWISLVPFTMQQIRPRFLPAIAMVSDFHEINLRTYVIKDNKPGVFFLNIEAEKYLSTLLSRNLSGLPYEKSTITRGAGKYKSSNLLKNFSLDVAFEINETVSEKSQLEKFLTERYALFLERKDILYRYDIHHLEWKIKKLDLKKLQLSYHIPGLKLDNIRPDLVQYSDGVEVIAWQKVRV